MTASLFPARASCKRCSGTRSRPSSETASGVYKCENCSGTGTVPVSLPASEVERLAREEVKRRLTKMEDADIADGGAGYVFLDGSWDGDQCMMLKSQVLAALFPPPTEEKADQ